VSEPALVGLSRVHICASERAGGRAERSTHAHGRSTEAYDGQKASQSQYIDGKPGLPRAVVGTPRSARKVGIAMVPKLEARGDLIHWQTHFKLLDLRRRFSVNRARCSCTPPARLARAAVSPMRGLPMRAARVQVAPAVVLRPTPNKCGETRVTVALPWANQPCDGGRQSAPRASSTSIASARRPIGIPPAQLIRANCTSVSSQSRSPHPRADMANAPVAMARM
jgi:hypothetical protein